MPFSPMTSSSWEGRNLPDLKAFRQIKPDELEFKKLSVISSQLSVKVPASKFESGLFSMKIG